MPKVSQEHRDARREQILAGARRCFARHGYAGATVARLEEEIELSRGAIFNYFPGKRALFAEVAIEVSSRFAALAAAEGLDAVVRAMAIEDPAWLGVLLEGEMQLRHDPEFQRLMEQAIEHAPRLSEWIREQQRAGAIRDDLPALDVTAFVGIVLNGLALRVLGEEETSLDPLLRLLHDALAPRK